MEIQQQQYKPFVFAPAHPEGIQAQNQQDQKSPQNQRRHQNQESKQNQQDQENQQNLQQNQNQQEKQNQKGQKQENKEKQQNQQDQDSHKEHQNQQSNQNQQDQRHKQDQQGQQNQQGKQNQQTQQEKQQNQNKQGKKNQQTNQDQQGQKNQQGKQNQQVQKGNPNQQGQKQQGKQDQQNKQDQQGQQNQQGKQNQQNQNKQDQQEQQNQQGKKNQQANQDQQGQKDQQRKQNKQGKKNKQANQDQQGKQNQQGQKSEKEIEQELHETEVNQGNRSQKDNIPAEAPNKKWGNMNIPSHIEKIDENRWRIKAGYVPRMRTDAIFYANDELAANLFTELAHAQSSIPALKQIANVAGIPGIVGNSIGMPDAHSGYGFAIGNVAATDMDDEEAIVSPGGVGYDINCGIRFLRTNLQESDVKNNIEQLADALYDNIPAGVGSESNFTWTNEEFERILNEGMDFLLEKELVWPEDVNHSEEMGRIPYADASKVTSRAKSRGRHQLGTLGSGNHYAEVQVVDEIYDDEAAKVMGLKVGSVCIMIHSGSRGLGHQVCTDNLMSAEREMKKYNIVTNDRQLSGLRINTQPGKDYLAAMGAAANFAFSNRSLMANNARTAFEKVFNKSAREMEMYQIYDVCHNMAKVEDHVLSDGTKKKLLVHRKGATRAFGPGHPTLPKDYQKIGQPVIVGGSMGTYSYILLGTEEAMKQTFGSSCHGAGRNLSRAQSKRELPAKVVQENLRKLGIVFRVGTPKLIAEEAPESYKDVVQVVETCHGAGICKKAVRLRPLAVVKG